MKHVDMDFPHAPVWCDDCRQEDRQDKVLFEMIRANDLKQREMDFREFDGEWIQSTPRPRPYVSSSPITNKPREGFVEPRRDQLT